MPEAAARAASDASAEASGTSAKAPADPTAQASAASAYEASPQKPAAASPPLRVPAQHDDPDASAAQQLDVHQLRELLRIGAAERVVAFARAHEGDDALALLLADGLRALGRFEDACAHYEALALRAPEPLRTQAGFAAAQLALLSQHDAPRALRDIEQFALDRPDSPLSERASTLHVQALLQLGRVAEAWRVGARYLAREPETEAKERMRRLLLGTGTP
jgi:tetratricopeptide (TPR) repeat protein